MTWKYLIKVFEDHRLVEIRLDVSDNLSAEVDKLIAEGVTLIGVFDRDGNRIQI